MFRWLNRSIRRFEEEQRRISDFLLKVDKGERRLSFFPRHALYLGRVLTHACHGFWFADGFSRAAALAYVLLVSMVPLAVLVAHPARVGRGRHGGHQADPPAEQPGGQ